MIKNVSVPEGYKKTELGVIPEEWEIKKLSEIFTLSSGKTRPSNVENMSSSEMCYPVYGGNRVIGYSNEYLIEKDTIVIGRVGENCGVVHETSGYSWITDNALYTKNILCPNISIKYFTSLLSSLQLNKYKKKTGQPLITQSTLNSLKLLLPPFQEQQKIASVLSKVDEQIEQTEQIIEKTEFLKKGLMQKLITKGIRHTKFKKTKIGLVPEQWEIKEIADVTDYVSYGFTNPMPTTTEGPFIITATNVDKGTIQYDYARHTSYEAYDKLTLKSKPIIDDVLLTKDGTLGNVGIVDRSDICINQSVACMRLKKEFFHLDFFSQLLQSSDVQKRILFDSGGSTIKHIYITKFAKMLISLPPLAEQQKISSILSKVDSQIQDNQSYLHKLQELKKGLMQDLLTGKVRVRV